MHCDQCPVLCYCNAVAQSQRVGIIEKQLSDQQLRREEDYRITKQKVSDLTEQMRNLQMEKETQPVTAQQSELTLDKLYHRVMELERENGKLQEKVEKLQEDLVHSERSKEG